MSGLSDKDFERFVLLHRATGGPKSSVNVFEIGMAGKQIRIRHGMKGKKLGKTLVKKSNLSEARNVFNDKKRQKIAEGYRIVKEKNGVAHGNANGNPNTNASGNNNSGFTSLRPFSFSFGQTHRPSMSQPLQSQPMRVNQQQQRPMSKENIPSNAPSSNNTNNNNANNAGDSDNESETSETGSQRRKQSPPKRHHKPKKDGNAPANHVNRRRKGKKGKLVNNKNNNLKNKGKNKKVKKKGKIKNHKNTNNVITNGNGVHSNNGEDDENDGESSEGADTNNDGETSGADNDEYYPSDDEEEEDDNDHDMAQYQDPSKPYMNGKSKHRVADEDEEDDGDDEEEDDEEEDNESEMDEIDNGHKNSNKNVNNARGGRNGRHGARTPGNNMDGNDVDNNNEDDNDGDEDEDDDDDSSSSSSSSSSSGRSSDDEYEMEYEKMAKIMADIVSREPPKRLFWKPLSMWIRYNEEIDYNAEWALAPMPRRIAGSCHELLVAYFKSSKGEFLTRLIKLARDPDEDNKHHFETERKVSQYLTKMAKVVNKCYHTRNDVCVWPVETIYFEYEDEMKWATVQAPFLPKDNYVFVKIEPNYGKPCVNDPIVGRYQHAFAAISKGLDLVRDWQGYGVSQKMFLKQCEITNVKEAIEQIVQRNNGGKNTQVLVVIDPVLTTCGAHYETNNPTDFGMKAIDEWLETHDCDKCRCDYFHLTEELRFGICDPNQKWFDFDKAPKYLKMFVKQCRKDLHIWDGDNEDDGWVPPMVDDDADNEEKGSHDSSVTTAMNGTSAAALAASKSMQSSSTAGGALPSAVMNGVHNDGVSNNNRGN